MGSDYPVIDSSLLWLGILAQPRPTTTQVRRVSFNAHTHTKLTMTAEVRAHRSLSREPSRPMRSASVMLARGASLDSDVGDRLKPPSAHSRAALGGWEASETCPPSPLVAAAFFLGRVCALYCSETERFWKKLLGPVFAPKPNFAVYCSPTRKAEAYLPTYLHSKVRFSVKRNIKNNTCCV